MKNYSTLLGLFILVFSMFMFSSCEDKKPEKESEKQEKVQPDKIADTAYQCPMDCEDGKTYQEAGSCPVCKMDLKETSKQHSQACKMHEGGECSCKADKCKCKDCKKHAKTNETCKKGEDGNCVCKDCSCENCAEHAMVKSCKKDKDGNCNCKKGECQCEDCSDHS